MLSDEEVANDNVLRECLSKPLIELSIKPAEKAKKRLKKLKSNGRPPTDINSNVEGVNNDAEDLADFIDVNESRGLSL